VPDDLFPREPGTAWLERCDSASLDRVAPFVNAVALTLVSHIEEIVRRLQPDAEPADVLRDFRASLQACRERGMPVEVEVPLATENASMLPETVAWIAEERPAAVRVVPFPARVASDRTVDPYTCFSERYLARIAQLCEQAVGDVRFVWEPRAGQTFGLARLPGFCEEAWGRVRIHRSGRVEPCMYAASGELTLGRIDKRRSLVDVWRGVNAQDLRRAHLSWDYPAPCTTCPRTVGTEPPGASEFAARFRAEVMGDQAYEPLEPLTPGLIARFGEPPVLRMHRPAGEVRSWHVAVALGGEDEQLRTFTLEYEPEGQDAIGLAFPPGVWEEMEPNLGYWWAAFAETADGTWAGMQRPHCLVRHQPLARIPRSRLRYPSPNGEVATDSVARATGFLKAEYEALIERVRSAVSGSVAAGSICLIATKGDDRFLDLDGSVGWHFPRGDDGQYAGYNPPDGGWAVKHLDELRAAGADYLVIPATSFWWREHYPELAAYLNTAGSPVLEERDTCLIVGLAPREEES
jgi:hypothetical protein